MNDTMFLREIEELCKNGNMEYIDAIVHWCEQNKIEIETIANFIKKDGILKSKIKLEAENLNYLKKGARLPI